MSLAFHPVDWSPLAWIAFVPWMVWHAGAPRRGTLLACIVAYHLHFSYVLAWVGEIVWVAVFLIPFLGYPFLYLLAKGMDYGIHRAKFSPILVYPLLIPGCEWLRDHILNLSWSSVGYTQWRWLQGLQLASVGRVHLLSVVVLLANAALATLILVRTGRLARSAAVRALAVAGGALVATHVFGTLELSRPLEAGPSVVGVQVNVPQWDKTRGDVREHLGRAARLLQTEAKRVADADLLVYPETSWPRVLEGEREFDEILSYPLRGGSYLGQPLRDLLPRKLGATAIVGYSKAAPLPPDSTYSDDDEDGLLEWNIAAVVQGGRVVGEVAKRKLVPFGEFVPWPVGWPGRAWLIERIRSVGGYVPDMIRGGPRPLFSLQEPHAGRRFGLSICYEIVDPTEFLASARLGADFLINISNDGWYRESAELDLVQVATQFRAVEVGRSIVRVSNTGISTLVDPRGRVLDLVEEGGKRKTVAGLLVGEVPIDRGTTPYVALGDWLGGGLLVTFFGLCLLRARQAKTP